MLSWFASARVQVPLAATAMMMMVAAVVLERTVGEVAPHAVAVTLAALAPISLLSTRMLFLRTSDARTAYSRALVWPPLLGLLVGPAVVGYIRMANPEADYSFGGVPAFDVGELWPLFVAAGSALASLIASGFLALQVWLVTHSERAQVSAWAWCSVCGLALTVLPLDARVATIVMVSALPMLAVLLVDSRRQQRFAMPAVGPYRS